MTSAFVQAATVVNWAGFNSRTVTLNGVVAGNSIIVSNNMCNFGPGVSSIDAASVNDGSAFTKAGGALNVITNAPLAAQQWYLHNASAGTHNIVLTSDHANSNNFGRITAIEVSGLQNAAPDTQVPNTGLSSTPQTASSGTLSQANEFVVANMVLATTDPSPAFTSPATTGYSSAMNNQTTPNMPASTDYKNVAATTAVTAAWGTITGGNEQWAAYITTWKDVVAGSAPTITSIVGTATGVIQQGETGVTITGTNFGSNTGSAAITLIDGNNSSLLTACSPTSWGSTSIQFTVNSGNVRNGPISVKVTTSGGLTVTSGVTLIPPTGTTSLTLGTLRPLIFDTNNTPSRLTDTPDITNNEQLEYLTSGGSGVITVSVDGNMTWPNTATQVTFRHHNGTAWSSPSHWDLRGLFPTSAGTIPTQNGVNGTALSWPLATIFSEADSASNPLTYSIVSGVLPTGLSINASTGVASGTPSVTGTQNGIIVQATNADSSYVQSNSFAAVIAANTNVTFSGTILDLPNLTVGQNVSIDTTPFFLNATSYSSASTLPGGLTLTAGVLAGTLTGAGIGAGSTTSYPILVTGANANPSTANSNTFTLSVNNPALSTTTVPDVSSAPISEAAAFASLVSAQLVPSATIDWSGSQSIIQSIAAGATVLTGTTVYLTPVGVTLTSFPGIKLIDNGSVTTPGGGKGWNGGEGIWIAVGTFGGAILNLQALGPDGQTWVTLATMSTPGQSLFYISACNIRTQVVGGSPSGLYSTVNRVPLG